MSVQTGLVKAVLSGDTIVVMGPSKGIKSQPHNMNPLRHLSPMRVNQRLRSGGPPPEKTLTLAGIIAPRLGRHYAKDESGMKDEPWAWESKEMIRKMCVGKAVSFRSEPTKGSTSREYALARPL